MHPLYFRPEAAAAVGRRSFYRDPHLDYIHGLYNSICLWEGGGDGGKGGRGKVVERGSLK